MKRSIRISAATTACAILTLSACADDGNDAAVQQLRATAIADELRVATTDDAAASTEVPGTEASDQPDTTEPTIETVPPTGVVVPVRALDNVFQPEIIEINVGDEVLWENRGQNEHNILYIEGDDWGVEVEDFGPGAFYAHVFTEPGTYRYYCSIHGTADFGMVGALIVSA